MITHDPTGERDNRARTQARERSEARAAVSSLALRLEALRAMTVAELHTEYRRLFGEPTHSRNRGYLRKKLAFRVQEIEEGGQRQSVRDRIEQLLDLGTTVRIGPRPEPAPIAEDEPAPPARDKRRDPRLPPPGTVLRREYKGEEHVVTVVEGGFDYRGQRFTSLSTLAKAITGTDWNGFGFFDAALRAAGAAPSNNPRPRRHA